MFFLFSFRVSFLSLSPTMAGRNARWTSCQRRHSSFYVKDRASLSRVPILSGRTRREKFVLPFHVIFLVQCNPVWYANEKRQEHLFYLISLLAVSLIRFSFDRVLNLKQIMDPFETGLPGKKFRVPKLAVAVFPGRRYKNQ